jgi:hypothetical protein
MKCPKCDSQMDFGRMLNNAMVWTGKNSLYESIQINNRQLGQIIKNIFLPNQKQ